MPVVPLPLIMEGHKNGPAASIDFNLHLTPERFTHMIQLPVFFGHRHHPRKRQNCVRRFWTNRFCYPRGRGLPYVTRYNSIVFKHAETVSSGIPQTTVSMKLRTQVPYIM